MNKLNSKWAFLILNAKSVAAFKPLSSRLTKTWARMSSCKKNQMFNRVCNYSYGVIQALAYSGDRHSKLACSAGVFWTAKTACSCSCCCSRYLWFYNSGRLGRVEVATLRVGADSPYFLLSFGVSNGCFCEQKHPRAREENACTAGLFKTHT